MKRRDFLLAGASAAMLPLVASADASQALPAAGATKVVMRVPMVLAIHQGDHETLVLNGDEALLKRLRTSLHDGVLTIDLVDRAFHDDTWKKERLSGVLSVKTLSDIELEGTGTLTVGPLKTDQLSVAVGGAALVVFERLQAQRLDMRIAGAAQVKGNGSVATLDLEVSGVGLVALESLACNAAKVSVSGSATVTVAPKDQLDAEVSGVGQVLYHGSPHVTQQVSGIGRVSPA